jgi:hypothetical protein
MAEPQWTRERVAAWEPAVAALGRLLETVTATAVPQAPAALFRDRWSFAAAFAVSNPQSSISRPEGEETCREGLCGWAKATASTRPVAAFKVSTAATAHRGSPPGLGGQAGAGAGPAAGRTVSVVLTTPRLVSLFEFS